MEKQYLYDYFGIEPDDYKGIGVDELDLSVRVFNRLHRYKIETIEDLLLISWEDMDGWYGFGKNCKDSLEAELNKLFSSGRKPSFAKVDIPPKFITSAYKQFEMIDIDHVFLSRSQKKLIERYNDAVTSLDKCDVDVLISNPEYCSSIIESLNTASTKLRSRVIAKDLINEIPDDVRKMPVQEVFSFFSDNYSFLSEMLGECDNDSFEETLFSKCEEWVDKKSFNNFYKWIKTNIDGLTDVLFCDEKFAGRVLDVLAERAKGNTLEQVGNIFGVTRERIRQIESKGLRFILAWDGKNKISKLIRMRYSRQGFISSEELINTFGKYGNVMNHYYKSIDSRLIRFERDYDGFVVCDEDIFREVQYYVDSLPDIIHVSDIDSFEGDRYPKELLRREILSQYKLTGDVYHRSRLTMTSVYSDILRSEYPYGIHVYDDRELNTFRKKVEEKYGDIKLSSTNRALGVRIADIGVLCGRGIYRPKQKQYITQELSDKIYEYLVNGDLPAVLTNTIFAVFEDELVEQGIDNKYFLQGIIRELYGNKFIFRRDYIIKDANFTNISSAVIDFVSKSNVPISKREIYAKFPGITEIVINLSMSDSRILNLFGSYIATKNIELEDDEIEYLKEVADKHTASGKSIHCKDIYDEVSSYNKMMLSRNFIIQPFGIYGLLEYLFPDDFNFDRPFIARRDVEIEKTMDSLYAKVSESDIVELEELTAIAKEKHFQINSLIVFANSCNDSHLLISNHQMASLDYLNIDESVAKQVEEIILNNVSSTMPISSLTCIHMFPKISIKWNEWIIYSLLNKYSHAFEVTLSSNQIRLAIPFLALKGNTDLNIINSTGNTITSGVVIADDLDNIDELIEDFIDDEIDI